MVKSYSERQERDPAGVLGRVRRQMTILRSIDAARSSVPDSLSGSRAVNAVIDRSVRRRSEDDGEM